MKNTISKKKVFSVGAMLILAFSLIYISFKSQIAESKENTSGTQSNIPTVFVHGYKGTYNSFKTMLYRFEQNGWGKKELVVYVSAEGEITWKGALHPDPKLPPLVQIVFEKNKASIAETSTRLQSVMKGLKDKFGVEQVYLVGHSMGGLVSTNYLESTKSNGEYPKTLKFSVIGSPFDGISSESYHQVNTGEAIIDLKPDSDALNSLVKKRESFPADIEVMAIAGSGDQVVDVDSAFAIQSIVNEESLQKHLIEDQSIGHSGLHETEKVDKLLKKFLWN
ncbi:alpha/beta hydrolase [Bacillus salacetis]|uniref:Alpha/beta hydrolase n=1 Tax=Bacillus salacetis TaxID=2315464 RepID=A0A3A1QQ22_9BACI|nr:alpha/beta fold hydrolase [Bacillus salacetis]RIW28597.1 alpha/beta hydrolase [Bacillus salacetis]